MENRVTVYTQFGYAQVDLDKYREEFSGGAQPGLGRDMSNSSSPDKQNKDGLQNDNQIKQESNSSDQNGTIDTSKGGQMVQQNAHDNIIEVQFKFGTGFIQKREIRSKIKVSVKTFHGKRTNFEFTVLVSDKLDRLREFLQQREPEEMSSYHVIKLVYPMGTIKHLNLDQTFEQLEIPHGAQLLLLGQKSFTWDLNYKGSNIQVYLFSFSLSFIQLLNNCQTANKKFEMDYETVLASVGFNNGRHYWEIKLDVFVEMEDIFVGVARRNIDLYTRAWDTGSFWGWICAGGRKFCPSSPGPMVQEYGGFSKINDVVGILLEFKDGIGSISFYNNGVIYFISFQLQFQQPLGTAFDNIPPGTYYPAVCLYYGEVQVTLNPKAKMPGEKLELTK